MAASADSEKACALTVTERVSSPRPSTFTSAPLETRPLRASVSGVISSRPDASIVSRLMAWYSTRNGLLKPAQLRDAHVHRQLAAFELTGMVPRAFWPLVPRPAVLPPLPPMPRPTRLRRLRRALGGLQIVDLHGQSTSSTVDEVRHLVDLAADLGRSRE